MPLLPSDCGTFAVGKCHIWTPKVPLLRHSCPLKAFQRPLSCPPVGRKCAFSVPDEEKTLRVFGELKIMGNRAVCVARIVARNVMRFALSAWETFVFSKKGSIFAGGNKPGNIKALSTLFHFSIFLNRLRFQAKIWRFRDFCVLLQPEWGSYSKDMSPP